MLPLRPWGLWFVNELLYWLTSWPDSLEETNTPLVFFFCGLFFLAFFCVLSWSCAEEGWWGGGLAQKTLLCERLKSCRLVICFFSSILSLARANLYCDNLRKLFSVQWCRRRNPSLPPFPKGSSRPPLNLFLCPSPSSLPCEDNNGFVWAILPALQRADYCVPPVLTQLVQALCLQPCHRLSAHIHNGNVTLWHTAHKDPCDPAASHKDIQLL